MSRSMPPAAALALALAFALVAVPVSAQEPAGGGAPAGPEQPVPLTGNPFMSDLAPVPPVRPGEFGFAAVGAPLVISEADRAIIRRVSAHHSA
ncbi:MAG TPA: hypothetical protein VMW31_05480, partial [Devosiaceae bacterium]|nr:hypothetical protein [Devosiaceae bacterium]